MTVEAKICGLSTPDTVDAAVRFGARWVGFNTYPRSPRYISTETMKALGARVIVVSRTEDKLKRALAAGADDAINSSVTPEWDQQVQALTDGKGARLVLDMGLTDSLRRATRAVAFEGTVAIIGVVQEETNPFDIFTVMNKNINVRGVETGSRSMFERMNAFIEQQRIVPVIDSVFGVDQVDVGLARLGASPFGKVVVRFD